MDVTSEEQLNNLRKGLEEESKHTTENVLATNVLSAIEHGDDKDKVRGLYYKYNKYIEKEGLICDHDLFKSVEKNFEDYIKYTPGP